MKLKPMNFNGKFYKTGLVLKGLLIAYVFGSVVFSSWKAMEFAKSLRVDFKIVSVMAEN